MQGDLLAEGVALMLVGMGTVFTFLLILVFATMSLGAVTQRLAISWRAAEVGDGPTLEEAAAIAAALHQHRR